MQFLKPIISKVTEDNNIKNQIKSFKRDDKAFDFLIANGVSILKIEKEFKSYYGIDFFNLKKYDIDKSLLNKFDIEVLKRENVLPIDEDKHNKIFYFVLGDIANEKSRKIFDKASKEIGYKVVYSFALPAHINEKYEEIEKNHIESNTNNELTAKSYSIERSFDAKGWLEQVINKGIELKSSDIHIEQFEDFIKVRYRVDGELETYNKYAFTESQISNINVRIKMISSLDISEKRKPQDGRIDDYEHNGIKYDMRISSVSTINGEKFTLRLFEKTSNILTFEDLGFSKKNEEIAKDVLRSKNGIIYLGGATGSGKTTTLYTMIENRNSEKVNIYTIENPVEKTVDNINQIQINELGGITYASTLKALLRQDPDIIVVGETRDRETIELSVRASLTGHLVLTTIHANNAIDSIGRVIDMGIEPYLIGASSIGFMSQRLVKRLCPHCKEECEKLEPYQEKWLEKNIKEQNMRVDINKLKLYKAKGCDKCNEGYKGRVAMVEILKVDDRIRSAISNGVNATTLKEDVMKNGFEPLIKDGINKIIEGVTTVEEVMKEIS